MKISLEQVLESLVTSINVVSRRPIFETYDKNVQGNTVHERGDTVAGMTACFRDFAELDEDHSKIAVAIGTGGNPSLAKIDPQAAAIDAIVQAALQTIAVGGVPLGATDCLNFGNPEKEDQMAEFVDAVEGLTEVCTALEIPIVSGNVSLYNESNGKSIPPSALVTVFSRVQDVDKVKPIAFGNPGDFVFVIGKRQGKFGGSELMEVTESTDTRMPEIDYADVKDLFSVIQKSLDEEKITSINVIEKGGALVSALHSAFRGNLGLQIELEEESEVPLLFDEAAGVVVSTSDPEGLNELCGEQALFLGYVREENELQINIGGKLLLNTKLDQLKKTWENKLREVL